MSDDYEKRVIFLTFAAVGKTYECGVGSHMTFRRILSNMKDLAASDLKNRYRISGREHIFEQRSCAECDPDVSVRSLNVHNGMHFIIF